MCTLYTHTHECVTQKCPGAFAPLGIFYLVGMLIANTLRHTTMVSGAGSYVCVMVEARGVEPLSENLSIQLSPSAVYLLKFPIQNADKQAFLKGIP